jgi:hypothetical protein
MVKKVLKCLSGLMIGRNLRGAILQRGSYYGRKWEQEVLYEGDEFVQEAERFTGRRLRPPPAGPPPRPKRANYVLSPQSFTLKYCGNINKLNILNLNISHINTCPRFCQANKIIGME